LGELTEPDLAMMAALGIRTVVDLRSGYEVENSRFNVDAHPVDFHHFPFIDAWPDVQEWDRRPGLLAAQYKEMLVDAMPQIRSALAVLAGPEAHPAVFHCTAGKDRTGLLSALLLSLLGVPEDVVVADYALSGEAMERLRAKLILKYPDGRDVIADIDEVFSADPANMVGLFTFLRQRFGDVAGWASAAEVSDELVSRLKSVLLEPSA
jgi:protein-tyrosine phosphatase